MPVHRPLEVLTFVKAVPPDLLQRYFDHFPWETKPGGWPILNGDALVAFLDKPENEDFSGIVLEQFRRINDVCADGAGILVRAYQRAGLPIEEVTPQHLALRLFLEAREHFDYAWSRYLLFGGSPKLSTYPFSGKKIVVSKDKVTRFQNELRPWFAGKAKGKCNVRHFRDQDETVILISRGTYRRTIACWDGNEIAFTTFRPAFEDVLVYDARRQELEIKASLEGERQLYLNVFAARIGGDIHLAQAARSAKLFSLTPVQSGTFDYSGDAEITKVELVKAGLQLFDGIGSQIELRSADVIQTIAQNPRYSLRHGELTYAKFRFHLRVPGERPTTVTFDIEPPLRTDLAQKRYATIVERYLIREGVKLA